MSLTINRLFLYGFFIFALETLWSSGLRDSRKNSSVDEHEPDSFFPFNQSLSDIYALTSSRTVSAKHVFRGVFLSYNDKIIPRAIIATFGLRIFYKNRFGNDRADKRFVRVIDRTFSDTYHCFKHLKKQKNYIVYLQDSTLMFYVSGRVQEYYWVSSKPQRATQARVKQVITYSCSECPSKPTLKLSHITTTNNGVKDLHIKCISTSECKLPVKSFWFKDRKLIQASENNEKVKVNDFLDNNDDNSPTTISPDDSTLITHPIEKYTIYNNHFYSILIINDIEEHDNGSYRCLMINVVGSRHDDFLWPVKVTTPSLKTTTTKSTTTPVTEKRGFKACKDNYYCMDRGQCLIVLLTNELMCSCSEEYYGNRCQYHLKSRVRIGGPSEKQASQNVYIFISILTFILLLLMIAVFCLVRSFERLRSQLYEKENGVRMEQMPMSDYSLEHKELIFEREQPTSNPPQTSTQANQYVESADMNAQNRINSDKPNSANSKRRAFTHYIFGPANTPPFKVKSPTFSGFGRVHSENSKDVKGQKLPTFNTKSSSTSSKLSKLPDISRETQSENAKIKLLDLPASTKSNLS